jgi:hypothetical protein
MLSFAHAVFHPAEVPEQRLILYSPLPDNDTPAKLAALLEGRAAQVRFFSHEKPRTAK